MEPKKDRQLAWHIDQMKALASSLRILGEDSALTYLERAPLMTASCYVEMAIIHVQDSQKWSMEERPDTDAREVDLTLVPGSPEDRRTRTA